MALSLLDAVALALVLALGAGTLCPVPVSLIETLSVAPGADTAPYASAPPTNRNGTTAAAVMRAAPSRRFRHPGCMPRRNAHQGLSFAAFS
jgi:hypothetical protein